MPVPPPRSLAERFASVVRGLTHAAVTEGLLGRLANPLVALITTRMGEIKQHFDRLAARVAAGTYRPPRPSATPRQKPAAPRPLRPSEQQRNSQRAVIRQWGTLPRTYGWLLTLVPEERYRLAVAGCRSHLEFLFRDPEMLALMQAAPASLRRPLRSLCWMLRVAPPPILAPRRRPPRPRPAAPARPESRKPRHRTDPPPGVPRWLLSAPPGKQAWFPDDLYGPSPDPETS